MVTRIIVVVAGEGRLPDEAEAAAGVEEEAGVVVDEAATTTVATIRTRVATTVDGAPLNSTSRTQWHRQLPNTRNSHLLVMHKLTHRMLTLEVPQLLPNRIVAIELRLLNSIWPGAK